MGSTPCLYHRHNTQRQTQLPGSGKVYMLPGMKKFSCSSPSNYKLESFHKTQFQSDMLPENHVSQRIFLPIQANDKTVTLWSRIIPMLTGKVPFLLPSTNNLTATRILVWFFVLLFGVFFYCGLTLYHTFNSSSFLLAFCCSCKLLCILLNRLIFTLFLLQTFSRIVPKSSPQAVLSCKTL